MKTKQYLALTLAVLLALSLLSGCAKPVQDDPSAQQPTASDNSSATDTSEEPMQDQGSHAELTPLAEIRTAKDYAEIRESLLAHRDTGYGFGGYGGGDGAVAETAAEEEPAAFNAAEGGAGYDVADFGTNVQVAGIDEADDVKTNGDYIFALRDMGVEVYRVDGANTADVGQIYPSFWDRMSDGMETTEDGVSVNRYSNGLLLWGNRLALLYTYNRWGSDADGNWFDDAETRMVVFDISDVSAPKELADLGQDGYYQSARMKDGVLYLISTNSVYEVTDEAAPEDYIPCVYNGESATMLPAERISLCPAVSWPCFTIVGSYAMDEAENLDACAFTGNTDTVYMDKDALYLARYVQNENASEPYAENQYQVVDYISSAATEIKRISLGGALALDASCELDGSLLNQFALDAHNGYLRVATSTYRYSYSIYTDEAYDFQNYVWHQDDEQNSRVVILDADLNEVGSVENLAADERIYSVRFIGDVGYVVTYKNIDPVFTLDLSDPTNPTVESALEVPGVSNYLHVFADGKLFGFGQSVNTDGVNITSDDLQLSMFDVSDPKNVSLESQKVIEDSYSNALYDHHALLIRGDQGLIGFPLTETYGYGTGYAVYRYDGDGFTEQGKVTLDYYPDGARGLWIDGLLYICGNYELYVLDLTDCEVIAQASAALG